MKALRKNLMGAALVTLLAVTTVGCGVSASGNSGSGSTDPKMVEQAATAVKAGTAVPTTITQDVSLKAAPPASGKLIFLANPLPATQLIGGGIKKAANAIGWDYSQVSYDTANPATLQAAFMSALAKKPSAVITSGVPTQVYGQSVIDAYDKANVPIVQAVSCPAQPGGTIVFGPNGCDFEKAGGKLFADWFVANSDGKGKALLADVTAYPSYATFGQAFRDEVAAICAGCSVKSVQLTADQVNNGQIVPTVVNTLRSSPDIKYVVFDNGEYTKGFDAALQAAGIKGIISGGRAVDEGTLAALKGGADGAWTASSYPLVGVASVDAALRVVTGTKDGLEKNFSLPIQLLTKDNVGDVTSPYDEPKDGLDQYLALWHVS